MNIWAIGDLHLSFGIPNKSMDIFGDEWKDHPKRLEENWDRLIQKDDLVLIPGDISWAMKLDEVIPDFEWIHNRPGTKVMIKGNHDYWWNSVTQIRKILPPSLIIIQNDVFIWKNRFAITGTRLWDSDEYSFDECITPLEDKKPLSSKTSSEEDKKIFQRELIRLEESLKKIPKELYSIAMTHYPPISHTLNDSRASALFSQYQISKVLFGHLHSLKKKSLQEAPFFGIKGSTEYILTSCDWLQSTPIQIL